MSLKTLLNLLFADPIQICANLIAKSVLLRKTACTKRPVRERQSELKKPMSRKDFILGEIEALKTLPGTIQKNIEKYLKDKTVPIDERWEILSKTFHRYAGDIEYEVPDGINWEGTSLVTSLELYYGDIVAPEELLDFAKEHDILENEETFKEWWLQSSFNYLEYMDDN